MKKSASSRPGSKEISYEKALQRAAGLCSRQEQCSSNIRDKLRLWNISDADAEKIIQKLRAESFLDDGRYAGFYAKDKYRFNSWGRIKITHTLRQKKVGEEEIENALSQIDEEEWFLTCLKITRQKSASLKEEDTFTRRGKLLKFAAGRGFEPDLIFRALDQLEKE